MKIFGRGQRYERKNLQLYNLGFKDCLREQKADFRKMIDNLGEERAKDNSLVSITWGKNFQTNSIKMLKEHLLAKLGDDNEVKK